MKKTIKSKPDKSISNEEKIQKEIDIFGIKLIKIAGVVGIFLGLIILSSFWFWVIKMLYKVG
jgi:hypothetical protein